MIVDHIAMHTQTQTARLYNRCSRVAVSELLEHKVQDVTKSSLGALNGYCECAREI
jgi:hypothetical protein